MKRDIAQEIRRTTSSRSTTDVVASRYSITRSDLIDGPLRISQKGIYTLSGSLSDVRWNDAYREVVLIASSNVELNLAGHEMSLEAAYAGSVPPDFALVRVSPGVQGVFVKGGTLKRAPVGVSVLNARKVQISDVEALGCFRRGFEFLGCSNVELLRSRAWLGPRTRSIRYEHAHQLMRLLEEDGGSLARDAPTTLVPELRRLLETEDESRESDPDPFQGWDSRSLPPPTEESDAAGIEIASYPSIGPALSPLVDFARATVVAKPTQHVGVLIDGASVLRDDAGYPISWETLFEEPGEDEEEEEIRSRKAILLAQLWIGAQTNSISEEVLSAVARGGDELSELRQRCVPILDADYRGTPLGPPRALRFLSVGNALVRRSEFACFNVSEPDPLSEAFRFEDEGGVRSYHSPFFGRRRDYLDASAVVAEGSQACTFDSVVVSGVQSGHGWAFGFLTLDLAASLILKDVRLGSILSIPARPVDRPPDDVRAVGVELCAEAKDVQIQNLQLDPAIGGEISCGAPTRGHSAVLSQGVPTAGQSFSAALGQSVLGFA